MSKWLDTTGLSSLSIAICDRCKMKYPYANQMADQNIPAIKVCSVSCMDVRDPYRLPQRKTENITIRFPRPDTSIAITDNLTDTNK